MVNLGQATFLVIFTRQLSDFNGDEPKFQVHQRFNKNRKLLKPWAAAIHF